ncbi:helix-turn-helix transcriptional regulator [Gordonia sp. 852002-10350_SCH5691597]|uniref:helix-turn-helix transcriptional regulator n=1 Tax=Gordonia sp. 852002-10350_SCH5691597 TaxID=1834085 RepID=UPI0007E9A444|nr:helix-turn-helix domain-containing protein [Gordonia sp. 852002-10350_SCH5691597]OBA57870.1 hypothetical protein A5777_06690 [Gordonia sp. 852002-10350_SCH5691597]
MTEPNPSTDLLTTAQVSNEYGISQNTLRWWRSIGDGPASFTLGRRKIVYRRAAIDEWIARQEQTTSRGGAA